jgi:galactokinase/mevalonate kinase-like predicted kinase
MLFTIAEAMAQNSDLDIIETFNSLRSVSAKVQSIGQLIDLCSQQQSDKEQHRYLVILARLFDELITGGTPLDRVILLPLWQRCYSSGLISKIDSEWVEKPVPDVIKQLSLTLRVKASQHLRAAIIALCPTPEKSTDAPTRARFSTRNASVSILAPVRLDLGMGGMSDIPPYSMERHGNCINMPIRMMQNYPIEVKVSLLNKPVLHFASKDLGVSKVFYDISEFDENISALRFHREAIRFFMAQFLDLNTIQQLFVRLNGGLRIETFSHLPVGTGLGVSTLLLCTIVKALGSLFDITLTPQMLFTSSVYLENVTGIGGGWEDVTAIYPGLKLMESLPEIPFLPQVKQLLLAKSTLQKLQDHLILVNTGISKQGQAFFDNMIENYCLRVTRTLSAIDRNNSLNRELVGFLTTGDLANIGQAMHMQWENWKILSEGKCSNHQIDSLFENVEPYVYGARINGAGQGGCSMFIVKEGKKHKLIDVIQETLDGKELFYKWRDIR